MLKWGNCIDTILNVYFAARLSFRRHPTPPPKKSIRMIFLWFFLYVFVTLHPAVLRAAIKAASGRGSHSEPQTGVTLWRYKIDTIVITMHNRRRLWRGKVRRVSAFASQTENTRGMYAEQHGNIWPNSAWWKISKSMLLTISPDHQYTISDYWSFLLTIQELKNNSNTMIIARGHGSFHFNWRWKCGVDTCHCWRRSCYLIGVQYNNRASKKKKTLGRDICFYLRSFH